MRKELNKFFGGAFLFLIFLICLEIAGHYFYGSERWQYISSKPYMEWIKKAGVLFFIGAWALVERDEHWELYLALFMAPFLLWAIFLIIHPIKGAVAVYAGFGFLLAVIAFGWFIKRKARN